MLPLLPVDEADPVRQPHLVHDRLTRAKASGQSEGGSAVVAAARNAPFALSVRSGVAMISYGDAFVFGITADYDTAPDIETLAGGNRKGIGAAAGRRPVSTAASQRV